MSTIDEVLSGDAQFAVVCGDATAVMKTIPDACVAVTYCDPSYGLSQQSTEDVIACLRAWLDGKPYVHSKAGFMQAKWDSWVAGPEAWREVHRCLKPGGYCVAFSSTRTVDLLGIAVRLAGFEMREGWSWAFGGAMPKSLNVSKAIDKEVGAEREVVGTLDPRSTYDGSSRGSKGHSNEYGTITNKGGVAVTAPATDAAIQWDGFGTTTKPAFEPLIVARKAPDGTVAHNVTTHGCGALNIDAARIVATGGTRKGTFPNGDSNGVYGDGLNGGCEIVSTGKGRFPAALALVHDEECVCEGTMRVAGQVAILRNESVPMGYGSRTTRKPAPTFAWIVATPTHPLRPARRAPVVPSLPLRRVEARPRRVAVVDHPAEPDVFGQYPPRCIAHARTRRDARLDVSPPQVPAPPCEHEVRQVGLGGLDVADGHRCGARVGSLDGRRPPVRVDPEGRRRRREDGLPQGLHHRWGQNVVGELAGRVEVALQRDPDQLIALHVGTASSTQLALFGRAK